MKIHPFLFVTLLSLSACSDEEKSSPIIDIETNKPIFYQDEKLVISGTAVSTERNINSVTIEHNDNIVYETTDLNSNKVEFRFDTIISRTGQYDFLLIVSDSDGLKSYENIQCTLKQVIKPRLSLAESGIHTDTIIANKTNFDIDVIVKKGLRSLDSVFIAKDSASNIIYRSPLPDTDSVSHTISMTESELGIFKYIIIATDKRNNQSAISKNITIE